MTKPTTINMQLRISLQTLSICARFYASKGKFFSRRGTFVKQIIEDMAEIIQNSTGIEPESLEEAIQTLHHFGFPDILKDISNKAEYVKELNLGVDVSQGMVEEAVRRMKGEL